MALKFKLLRGQENEEKTTILEGITGLGLRRTYIVVVGAEAPEGEIGNAAAITQYLRRKLNIAVGGGIVSIKDNTPGIQFLTKACNVVVVGGPSTNYYTYALNEFCNPKFKITLKREFDPANETWQEFVAGGNLTVDGYLIDDTLRPFSSGKGMIGVGKARLFDTIIIIAGTTFEDACAIGKAFREGKGAGLYTCTYTQGPDQSVCPVDAAATLDEAPAT